MVIAFVIFVGIQITTTKLRIWFFFKQKIWKVLPYLAGQIWINHPGKSNLPFVSDEARDSLPKQRPFWRKKTTIYAFIFQEVIAHFHDFSGFVVCRWQVSLSNQPTIHPTNQLMKHLNMDCLLTDSWCLTQGDLFLFLWYIFDIFSWNVSNV